MAFDDRYLAGAEVGRRVGREDFAREVRANLEAEIAKAITRLVDLAALSQDDPREAHVAADGILCSLLSELGHGDIVAAWDNVEKWYG